MLAHNSLRVAEGEPLFISLTTMHGASLIESLDNIRSIRPLEEGCVVEPKRGSCYAVQNTLYELQTKLATYGRLIGETR